MLDPKDVLLLEALQDDASKKLDDLAKLVHLAPSSVHDRLRRLASSGAIRQWTIRVDYAALNLDLVAFIGVRSSVPCAEIVKVLVAFPEIEECHSVAGAWSLYLKVRVARTADLMDVTERLRSVPGIEHTETTIVLKTQIERPARAAKTLRKRPSPTQP